MPQYYFHVANFDSAADIKDNDGDEFSDPQAAMTFADRVARELAQEQDPFYRGCIVLVIDEQGDEIGKIPVRDRAQ
jgi:hypothetical protein